MWILPAWAPEFRGFLPRCFVAQCKQSPSCFALRPCKKPPPPATASASPAFSSKHPHIDELLRAAFSFPPPPPRPFRRDMWIGVDLHTRPPDLLLKQSGLDFTRDLPPSSPHASETDGPPVGNGLRAVCQRINLHPSVLRGKKGNVKLNIGGFFFFGGGSLFLEKGRK